jgi:transcriptional regulator GlxA family with amidase domain
MMSNIGMHFLPESNGDELVDIAQRAVVTQLRHFPLIRNLAEYLDFLLFRSQAENREEQNRFGAAVLSVFLENVRMGPEGKVDRLIRKQAEAMRAQPERTRSSQELADAVGLSFSQFARRFYKMFEMSPREFLLEQRVEKARVLLRESQMTVGEISEALGYRDVGYFSRQFKQKNGLSPLAERKRFLNHE